MGTAEPLQVAVEANWIEAGPLEAVPRLGARVVRTATGDIAVFRTADDDIFALEDRCPHRGGPLSQGIVTGCQVICPLHDWCIDLADGEAVAPDQGLSRRHEVRIENDTIYIKLSTA